jgi:signal transduction histidine kinase
MLIPDERLEEEPRIIAQIRAGKRIDHFETIRRRKDGSLLDVSITVSPIRNANGEIIGASKVARDITDRVRAKEKLELTVAERTAALRDIVAELEAFSYSIAHDMRAPLRAMNSYAQIVQEDYSQILPEEGRDFLDRIASSARRLDTLITDVLNYSRISRGEMPLEPINVTVLIREIIDSYANLRANIGHISVEDDIPPVLANKAALTQCFSNLLSNALKFIPDGIVPRIAVRSEQHSGFVRIWVEDNGIGISEEGRKRIFHMFQRLNPAPHMEGNGIGLTIVRKAAERMRGRVGVESEPGAGSRFWIELPVVPTK